MNNQDNQGSSRRFPKIVGRKTELERFNRYLKDRGPSNVIYFWANGGYGKTRLLEALQDMVKDAGPGFFSGGMIDLYHTASHGSSDVERLIINNLMRSGGFINDKYFVKYRAERALFETIRDRGADPGELEKRRAALSEIFIDDFNRLAADARKIVICFDTMELIQYESMAIEEIVGMDQVDPRIRAWMLDKLPRLKNVLIVFAGRPQSGTFHHRLVEDMQRSFKETLEVFQLDPFSKEEMGAFFEALPDGKGVLSGERVFKPDEAHPSDYSELIYLLTGGRPNLLHLVYDLLRHLSEEPREVYAMFDAYQPLLEQYRDTPVQELDQAPEVQAARQKVEREIIRQIINSHGMGGELSIISYLPKGVNVEIICTVMGIGEQETTKLIEDMTNLSFIKQHVLEQGEMASVQTQGERLFFHDEMYRLMTDPLFLPNVRLNERWTSEAIINRFYDKHIKALEEQIRESENLEDKSVRIRLRETRDKLLTERLYYMLERDPISGYAEYKRLTALANADRSTGFAMRVRDEFLRFYNTPARTRLFEEKGILHDHVIRDSIQMWIERYHWGGFYDKAILLGEIALKDPERFNIHKEDVDVLGNICALWSRAYTMQNGFNETVLQKTQEVLALLPCLEECTPNELLARGRLASSIGYIARWGGFFNLACDMNLMALASFRKLDAYLEEQAIVLNNLAYVSARRGQISLARIYGQQAVKLNKQVSSEYSLGLSYTNLAAVERIAGTNYTRAVDYAEQALQLFLGIEDFHGLVRSYLNLGSAWREIALEQMGAMNLGLAVKYLEDAENQLLNGLQAATNGKLKSEIPGLQMELGKVYRTQGRAYRTLGDAIKSMDLAQKSIELFNEAQTWSGWSNVERADIEEDVAESVFDTGDWNGALKKLDTVRIILEAEIQRSRLPNGQVPNWYYLQLGKVERLYSHILMRHGRLEEGLIGFATAYADFHLFSPIAVEKTQMLEQVFQQHLSDRPFTTLSALVDTVKQRLEAQDCKINDVDVMSFINDLKELIGIR